MIKFPLLCLAYLKCIIKLTFRQNFLQFVVKCKKGPNSQSLNQINVKKLRVKDRMTIYHFAHDNKFVLQYYIDQMLSLHHCASWHFFLIIIWGSPFSKLFGWFSRFVEIWCDLIILLCGFPSLLSDCWTFSIQFYCLSFNKCR